MDFEEALARLGFREAAAGRHAPSGVSVHTAQPNRFLTYTVQVYEDGTALFSWEFALGEYLLTKGIQFGSDETLNQFAFNRDDRRGPQTAAWLAESVAWAEELLASIRLDAPVP